MNKVTFGMEAVDLQRAMQKWAVEYANPNQLVYAMKLAVSIREEMRFLKFMVGL